LLLMLESKTLYCSPGRKPEGEVMGCPVCKRLERTFEGWNTECVRARSSLYGSVSSRFAAYDVVEMERARSELKMHRSVCASSVAEVAGLRLASAARGSVLSPIRRAARPPSA
jgi:hypothetical protein